MQQSLELVEPVVASPASRLADSHIVVFNRIPQDAQFRQQWDDLVLTMETPEIFYTWEWADAVARAFRGSLEPVIFAAFRGQALMGVAALSADEEGYLSFLCAATADYCELVSKPADRAELWRLVLQQAARMDAVRGLRLANMPADSASAVALRTETQRLGYSIFIRPAYHCAQLKLNSQEDRRIVAQSAKRRMKKLSAAAREFRNLAVEHVHTWEGFMNEFPRFAASHMARFRAAGQVSNLVDPKRQVFAAELAKLLSSKEWLVLSLLKAESRTIAWNFGFVFANKWFYYQPTFDPGAQRLSPGIYLLSDIIRAAAENPGIAVVDLGLGDEDYKSRFAQAVCRTLHITISSSKARISWCATRYRAATLVKRSPSLEKLARACRSKLREFRSEVLPHK